MQKNSNNHAAPALAALAEVLRQARSLWPLQESAVNDTVTLQIDILKDLEANNLNSLPAGEVWALCRTNNKTAQVKRTSLASHDGFDLNLQRFLFFGTGISTTTSLCVIQAVQTRDTSSHAVAGRATTQELLGDPVAREGTNGGLKPNSTLGVQMEANSVGSEGCCSAFRKHLT